MTKTYEGDLIPKGTSGYAHYWLKMLLNETTNNGTQATVNIKIYFCRDDQSGDGYHFNNYNMLGITANGTQIRAVKDTTSIQINGGVASEVLICDMNYNFTAGWSGTITATFQQTQATIWSGSVSGIFSTSSGTNVYVYDGANWKQGIPWVYDGTNWRKACGKTFVYNGSTWKS